MKSRSEKKVPIRWVDGVPELAYDKGLSKTINDNEPKESKKKT